MTLQFLLQISVYTRKLNLGDRSFTAAGPHCGLHLRDFELSLFELCRLLKTHLFG